MNFTGSFLNMQTSNSDNFIRWLFKDRCIICGETANVVHEIRPRSSGQEAMDWKNRVTLCNDCHTTGENAVHRNGTSAEAISELQERRIEFLEMIGRAEYV